MKKKRLLAALLVIAMILVSCTKAEYGRYEFSSAEETEKVSDRTEETRPAETESQKETKTEPETDAPTETPSDEPTETEAPSAETEKGTEKPTETESKTEDESGSIFDQLPSGGDDEDTGGFVVTEGVNTAYQLTEADIQKMNNGKAIIIRSNDGYVSTLIGKFYDKKINVVPGDIITFEEAVNSLDGLATLLGFRAGTEFFADNGARDKEGYTYLTYRQKYAGSIVQNATMHIVLDPDCYPCAVSCSFTPEIGISEGGAEITAEQALASAQKVVETAGYSNIKFYKKYTEKAAVPFMASVFRCWVVVSDNPEEQDGFEYMQYMKYYIDAQTGDFLFAMPSTTLTLNLEQDNYPTDEIFSGLEPATYTAKVDFLGIGKQKVTISTAYNPNDGMYYMIDLDRKIAIADYGSFMDNYAFVVNLYSSSDNTWDERDVAAMYNYAAAYDGYAAHDVKSPDGFESPILALRHWEENGEPVNNAVFISYIEGWYVFGYSEANNYCYDLDAMAHEYTHAVTMASIAGSNYLNDAGAVNEAYSDVMGNLIEMMAGRTTDTTWELAENSGESLRNMSSPYNFNQPYAIGDVFYVPNTAVPFTYNDQGGVHTNSSIINYVAYYLNSQGMTYEELFDLFYTSMQILTPVNNFQDVYAALIYSARSNGYERYEDLITKIFTMNGVLASDRQAAERNYQVSGCGRITFQVNKSISDTYGCLCTIVDYSSGQAFTSWPSKEGLVTVLVPASDTYYVIFQAVDLNSGQLATVYTGTDGWVGDMNYASLFSVSEGQETILADIN